MINNLWRQKLHFISNKGSSRHFCSKSSSNLGRASNRSMAWRFLGRRKFWARRGKNRKRNCSPWRRTHHHYWMPRIVFFRRSFTIFSWFFFWRLEKFATKYMMTLIVWRNQLYFPVAIYAVLTVKNNLSRKSAQSVLNAGLIPRFAFFKFLIRFLQFSVQSCKNKILEKMEQIKSLLNECKNKAELVNKMRRFEVRFINWIIKYSDSTELAISTVFVKGKPYLKNPSVTGTAERAFCLKIGTISVRKIATYSSATPFAGQTCTF